MKCVNEMFVYKCISLTHASGGEHASHSSIFLPGESPSTEVPGRLQSIGLQRVGHDWVTKHNTCIRFYIMMIQNSWKKSRAK